jgi:beta-galactosidase
VIVAAASVVALLAFQDGAVAPPAPQAGSSNLENLARRARATGSETQDPYAAPLAIDGDPKTRWSGIPGHNEGVWFELAWDAPVEVGCVVIHQFDRFVTQFDLDAWDESSQKWTTLAHFGNPRDRLPLVILWRAAAAATKTSKLRLARIANGPSFTEFEVYAEPSAMPPELHASGDADGHIVAIVTDRFGTSAVGGAHVSLTIPTPSGPRNVEATSDDHGLLFVEAPPGMTGAIATQIAQGAAAAPEKGTLDAASLPVALTPFDDATPKVKLGGHWHCAADPEPDSENPGWARSPAELPGESEIPVPSHLVMHGLEPAGGVAVARRRFQRIAGAGDERVKLRFDGAYSGAEVFVNGTRCAYHEGGATPFEADVTDLLGKGDNLLALRLREHTETSDKLDRMSQYADFPLLGIWRDVTLFTVPAVHVASLQVTPKLDVSGGPVVSGAGDGRLDVRLACVNEGKEAVDGDVTLELNDPNGHAVPLQQSSAPLRIEPWSRAVANFGLTVPHVQTWDADHPRRYELVVTIHRQVKTVQRLSQRIGFRQTDVRGAELLINGAPTKFRGTCHHDGDPLLGRAVTAKLERDDVELILGANLNALRTSHYPPNTALLDAADELGCYVEDEASFCWVGDSNDLRLAPRILQLTAELLARDRDHPSVFMWSLCNESEFGWGFERSHEWVRAADPSRPCGAATSATLEIATAHNPITLQRIDQNEKLDRPLLFDESFCIWQGIFGDVGELQVDPGIRDEAWVLPLNAISDRFFAAKATQGSMIWCYADDLFCVPGRGLEYGREQTRSHFADPAYRQARRGLVGDAPWGFVDGWRRKKPEYFHVHELFAPVKVGETKFADDGSVSLALESRFDDCDLSECTFEWQRGEEKGHLAVAAPPRQRTTATIPAPPHAGASDHGGATEPVRLTVADPRGRIVLEREFFPPASAAKAPTPATAQAETRKPPPLRIVDEGTLAGDAVRIRGEAFEFAFDRRSGALRRGDAAGAPALLEWPRLHVLARTEALAPRPPRNSLRLEALDVTPAGDGAKVVIRGRFGDFPGVVEAEISTDGRVHATTRVTNDGPDLDAREIGMTLSLPLAATRLTWERAPDGRIFPDDSIGRPRGNAEAFPSISSAFLRMPRSGPPTWPFSLDPSALGCNDFRSTKRSLLHAELADPDGAGVRIEAGGRQHVRACVEDDRVRLCVLDYSGGSAVGWGEWDHNYGRGKPIKKGDTIESSVDFRLLAPTRHR